MTLYDPKLDFLRSYELAYQRPHERSFERSSKQSFYLPVDPSRVMWNPECFRHVRLLIKHWKEPEKLGGDERR